MKIFVINIRESVARRRACMGALVAHGVARSDIEVVHPLMVRDFPSQDEWCDAAGGVFLGLKGCEPLVQISYLHTYLRCLEKIEKFGDDGDFALILEDDCFLNMDMGKVDEYLGIAWERHPSNFFFVQLACWGNEGDRVRQLSSEKVLGTPFYYGGFNGSFANVMNGVAALVLKELILFEISARLVRDKDINFAPDMYIGEIGEEYDFCTVPLDSELFVKSGDFPTEYLSEGGELTLRCEFERRERAKSNKLVTHHYKRDRDLPVYDLPRPLGSFKGSRHCIIYPLFIGNDDEVESDYHTYLVNSGMWAAHGWRVKSNLEEKEWDIWFFVERRLFAQKSIRQQFVDANLLDFVVLFDAVQGEAVRRKFGLKFYATLNPAFDQYVRAYVFDADLFLCTQEGVTFDVDWILDIGKDESLFNILAMDPCSYFRLQRPPYNLPTRRAQARLRYHLENYLGASLGRGYTRTLGGIQAWNPKELREDFKEMVRMLTPHVSNDENQVAVYRRKMGLGNLPLGRIWSKNHDVHLVGFHDVFMATELPYFFEHVVLGTRGKKVIEPGYDRDAFLTKWYQYIGVT